MVDAVLCVGLGEFKSDVFNFMSHEYARLIYLNLLWDLTVLVEMLLPWFSNF